MKATHAHGLYLAVCCDVGGCALEAAPQQTYHLSRGGEVVTQCHVTGTGPLSFMWTSPGAACLLCVFIHCTRLLITQSQILDISSFHFFSSCSKHFLQFLQLPYDFKNVAMYTKGLFITYYPNFKPASRFKGMFYVNITQISPCITARNCRLNTNCEEINRYYKGIFKFLTVLAHIMRDKRLSGDRTKSKFKIVTYHQNKCILHLI